MAQFVSERDRGLYDAMNKGAARASGDVIAFLNADDWYADDAVLADAASCFERGADLVYGGLCFVSPRPPFAVRRVWRDAPRDPADLLRRGWHPAHPTCFVRRDLFAEVGGFDTRWRIAADFAFLARCMLVPGVRIRHLGRILVNMRIAARARKGCAPSCAGTGNARGHWPSWACGNPGASSSARCCERRSRPYRSKTAIWRPWSRNPRQPAS